MRDLNSCSGPWVGQWIQGDVRGTMRMLLVIHGGSVLGSGADFDGGFSIVGDYELTQQRVVLVKRYADLQVTYLGVWDGDMISGSSTINGEDFLDSGSFEMWPENDDLAMKFNESELSAPLTKIQSSEPSAGCRTV